MKSEDLHPIVRRIAVSSGANTTMDNRVAISRWIDLNEFAERLAREFATVAAQQDSGEAAAAAILNHIGVRP